MASARRRFRRPVIRDPKALTPLGARAHSKSDPASARSAIDLITAPGWLTYGWDGGRVGWVKRVPRGWGITALALFGSLFGQIQREDPDRNGDGWLIIDVRTAERGPGSIVEIRGEIDVGMERAVESMLSHVNARVDRWWDPTEQVADDVLPAVP